MTHFKAMDLRYFDNKCVRITTVSGDVYEGIASYLGREYVYHEYGCDQEALYLTPILFYKNDILNIMDLENTNGIFGHYSDKYGLLEKDCLDGGTDLIGEIFDSDDDDQILRMLYCMNDSFQSIIDRGVPGKAPWRSGMSMKRDNAEEDAAIYLGELEDMLDTLVKYNKDDRIVKEAKSLLERLFT